MKKQETANPHFLQTVRSLTTKALQDKVCNRANAQCPHPTACGLVSTRNSQELDGEKMKN